MTDVSKRYLAVGLVVAIVAGMGLALATTPAAAQASGGSPSADWWGDSSADASDDDSETDDSETDDSPFGSSSDGASSSSWWGGDDDDDRDRDDDDDRDRDDDDDRDRDDDDDRDRDDDDDRDRDDNRGDRGDFWNPGSNATLESASAEVTGTSIFSDRVGEVTFTITGTEGAVARLKAGRSTSVVRATGDQQEVAVRTGFLFGASSPVDVSASIRSARCEGTVSIDGGSVQLCDTEPPEPAPDFGVSVAGTNSPVTEGETLTVQGSVENAGDSEGTQDVTVSVADASVTESVTVAPGDSATVSLDWQTEAGDAGDYDASVSTDGDSASTTVTVNPVATEGTVSGTVTDSESGDAIAGATVSAGGAETTTADDGSYSLTLAEGGYTLQVSADGYESASQDVTVTAGETTTADVALTATPEPDPANFQLSNPSVNSPTEGNSITAEATVENTGGQEGTQTVSLSVGDLGSDSQEVTLAAGASTTVSLSVATSQGDAGTYTVDLGTADDSLSTEVTVAEVVTEGAVEGTVTDSESSNPIAGATVSAGGAEATTGSDGSYSLTLAEGDYTLQVSADGYGSTSQDVTVTAGETTTADVALTAAPDPANFQLSNPSVNSPTAGESITAEATVENTGGQEGTQTVSLSVGDLGSDSQDVTLGTGESTSVSLSVATSEGDAGTYTAELSTADDSVSTEVTVSEPVTEGTVSGTVTDADSGQGVGGATVSAGDAEATTADDGSYSLTLTEGDYTVSANTEGYESASQDVTVTAGETTTADFDLTPETAGPQEFTAYVHGTDAYLHTNVASGSTNPIEFTECRDYEPTQSAIDNTPSNLPAPSCTTINGTHYPSNNTWSGDVDFPAVVQQRNHDLLGEILVEASITTDGASGTMNRETGEITMDATVDIGIQIYAPENGHDHEWSNRPDPITNSACRVPSLGIELSTEKSYESQSSFTGGGTVSGQRMGADGVSYLVTNDFPVDGATDCGNFGGLVPLDGSINDVLGIPTDVGQNEVAFDVETNFEE